MTMNMPDALAFLILSLAVWRISRMATMEDGPFDVLSRIRERIGVHKQETWVHRGLACVACVSFWIGLFAGVCWRGANVEGLICGLAISAVSVVLMKRVG
jgi:hypothetical protein